MPPSHFQSPASRTTPARVPEPTGAEVIAHRGANREAPENTLSAFEAAVRLGADGIELDVQVTFDGTPVVHHDATLPGRPGSAQRQPIFALTDPELRKRAPGVPFLEEVLEAVGQRCRLYVELKDPRALDAVLRCIGPVRDACAIHSFDHRVIARAASLDSRLQRGLLLVSRPLDPVGILRGAEARDLWQHADMIDAELVETVHSAGCRVIAWTVNDPARARFLVDSGVDGICTDATRELRALIDSSS